jgi:transposase
MPIRDARSLPPVAQEDLRRKAVQAVREGMTQGEAARVFGVSRGIVNQWVGRYQAGGARALAARRRGRPPEPRLSATQRAEAIRLITGRCPDQLRLPFALWTREAVQQLLVRRFGVEVSVWTVGRYLRRGGLTPQKPLRRAYEQNPELVRRWLEVEYPAIRAQAQREQAQIHWGDEMGFRSDHQAGRSYGRRGHTPVIPGTGERFRGNAISTLTNRGRLYFMVFTERFTAKVLLRFLRRLLRQVPGRVFLILDRHPVHKAAEVQQWLAAHQDRLRLFWLPGYSPELNPDELLNQDVKTNAVGRQRPRNREEMLGLVRSYLHATQRRPDVVRSYFQGRHVQYAAI